MLDLDRLAGLDDGAGAARAERASSADHDPRSDQPTSIDAMTTWPSLGGALHDRVVDGDRLLDRS